MFRPFFFVIFLCICKADCGITVKSMLPLDGSSTINEWIEQFTGHLIQFANEEIDVAEIDDHECYPVTYVVNKSKLLLMII